MSKNKFEKQPSGFNLLNFETTPNNRAFGMLHKDGIDDFSFTKKSEDFPLNNQEGFGDFLNPPLSNRADPLNSFRGVSPMTRRQRARIIDQSRAQRFVSPDKNSVDLSK